jgi:hypothetical protein
MANRVASSSPMFCDRKPSWTSILQEGPKQDHRSFSAGASFGRVMPSTGLTSWFAGGAAGALNRFAPAWA